MPDERLRNYRYRWIPREGGTPRLLECPKPLLKETQRQVLRGILDVIPPHPDAHGFRRGHSPLTNARRHTGQEVVIGFDLEDFFASVAASRVYGIFRSAGYPEGVAHQLTALCTNIVPQHERPSRADRHAARRGAACTVCTAGSQRLICRRAPDLARARQPRRVRPRPPALRARRSHPARATRATPTTSPSPAAGACSRSAKPFRTLVAEIVEDEGFRLNRRKSRLTTRAGRQAVTGIVVNERPNPGRREYDALRATLHDAALRGPHRRTEPVSPISAPTFSAGSAGSRSSTPRAARSCAACSPIDW